jgi:magnesium chelatase family protein
MRPGEARSCALGDGAAKLLGERYSREGLSGRAHDRILRLARTVADLAGSESIGEEEMAQALHLRRREAA